MNHHQDLLQVLHQKAQVLFHLAVLVDHLVVALVEAQVDHQVYLHQEVQVDHLQEVLQYHQVNLHQLVQVMFHL